jgi:hypothetical protein
MEITNVKEYGSTVHQLPSGTHYIGRYIPGRYPSSPFWNRHKVGHSCPECKTTHTRSEAIAKFRDDFLSNEGLQRLAVEKLSGAVALACWCAPEPCHGSVLVEYLESCR